MFAVFGSSKGWSINMRDQPGLRDQSAGRHGPGLQCGESTGKEEEECNFIYCRKC